MSLSITDPLTLLREFTIAKRPVVLKDGNILFTNTLFERKTLTAYRSGLTGTGAFYALDITFRVTRVCEAQGVAKSSVIAGAPIYAILGVLSFLVYQSM